MPVRWMINMKYVDVFFTTKQLLVLVVAILILSFLSHCGIFYFSMSEPFEAMKDSSIVNSINWLLGG